MCRQASLPPCPRLGELVSALSLFLARTLQAEPLAARSSHCDVQIEPGTWKAFRVLECDSESYTLSSLGILLGPLAFGMLTPIAGHT